MSVAVPIAKATWSIGTKIIADSAYHHLAGIQHNTDSDSVFVWQVGPLPIDRRVHGQCGRSSAASDSCFGDAVGAHGCVVAAWRPSKRDRMVAVDDCEGRSARTSGELILPDQLSIPVASWYLNLGVPTSGCWTSRSSARPPHAQGWRLPGPGRPPHAQGWRLPGHRRQRKVYRSLSPPIELPPPLRVLTLSALLVAVAGRMELSRIGRCAEAGGAEHDSQDGQGSEDELLHGTLLRFPRIAGLVVFSSARAVLLLQPR